MSEPKLISPLLDNFEMGDPISEHDGVRCCPAMEVNSSDKYIVKIISIPASATQLDALLLSGAFSDEDAANSYFKMQADDVINEATILQKLSQTEGFVPYAGWQIQPMDDAAGFDVYLLTEYKNTLLQHLRCGSLTHLAAVNLGIDLCAALASCRRLGCLYVNLKPSNIYMINDHGYRIGDIGFLSLDSLKYSSLPDRYRSDYTAPEITDAFSSLNTTIDIYAVGLILYQVYNNGILPSNDASDNGELPPPIYADYEMSEIILKACAADPENRWQDPVEMGQALIAYMQRNGANDVPIVTPPIADTLYETEDCVESESDIASSLPADESSEADSMESEQEDSVVTSTSADVCDADITEDEIFSEDEDGNLTFLDDTDGDETLPGEGSDDIEDIEITDEVSDMLEQADELIAHETPDPVVQPEPIDVPIPSPIVLEDTNKEVEPEDDCSENNFDEETATSTPADIETETIEDNTSNDDDDAAPQSDEENAPNKASKKWVGGLFLALAIIAILVAGLFFYKNYYLQPIDAIILEDGGQGTLTVYVTSAVPEHKLIVICSDTYGNQLTSAVVDGKAVFNDLAPNAAYRVNVKINGFHRLTGDTSAAYTTPKVTNIVQFTAVTGNDNGSVVLGFTIDGPDSEQWQISYRDDSGQEKEIVFSGHVLTINALTVGNTYNFTLTPIDDIEIAGINEVQHVASSVVKASTVMITGCVNNQLTVIWGTEDNVSVDSWTVRCYSANGFDQAIVTTDQHATFEVPEDNAEYTVEVIAFGMSVAERAYAAADAITVGNFKADDSDPNQLIISWETQDTTPADGWVLLYTINGSTANEVVCKDGNTAVISPIVPGCEYNLTLQSTDGRQVLGGIRVYNTDEPDKFNGYGVNADLMEFRMCRTPSYSGWNRFSLSSDDYTTTFVIGENASFLVHLKDEYNVSNDTIVTLFAFRDENNAVVSTCTTSSTWSRMWYRNYCELDIPSLPQTPGEYTVSIYFNGAWAGECSLTIVEE